MMISGTLFPDIYQKSHRPIFLCDSTPKIVLKYCVFNCIWRVNKWILKFNSNY
jgi:hypothetical protein